MSGLLSLSFSPQSLSEIARFYSFGVFLSDEMAVAMKEAGDVLTAAAVANTWSVFAHPTGNLASGIHPVLDSPFEVQVMADVIYSHRREYGFQGMTDSLGRSFPNDGAKPYLQPALDDNEQSVLALIESAAERAFGRMGASF